MVSSALDELGRRLRQLGITGLAGDTGPVTGAPPPAGCCAAVPCEFVGAGWFAGEDPAWTPATSGGNGTTWPTKPLSTVALRTVTPPSRPLVVEPRPPGPPGPAVPLAPPPPPGPGGGTRIAANSSATWLPSWPAVRAPFGSRRLLVA